MANKSPPFTTNQKESNSTAKLWPRVLLVLLFIVFLFYSIDFSKLVSFFSERWRQLFIAIAIPQPLLVLSFFFLSQRLKMFSSAYQISGRLAFSAYVLSVGCNTFMPARLAEFVKPAYLLLRAGTPVASGLAYLVLEKTFDLLAIGIMIIAIGLNLTIFQQFDYRWAFLFLPGLVFIRFGTQYFLILYQKFAKTNHDRVGEFARTISQNSSMLNSIKFALVSILGWSFSLGSVYVCLNTITERSFSIGESAFVFFMTLVGGLIAVLPAGIGTFHAMATYALTEIGVELHEAAAISIVLHIQAYVFAVLFTAYVIAVKRAPFSEIKTLINANRITDK